MANENSKKKGLGWFKSGFLNQEPAVVDLTEDEKNLYEYGETSTNTNEAETENNLVNEVTEQNNHFISKENQDKVILDAIVSLENVIKDRQLIVYKNKDLEEQLYSANETISRTKQDLLKKEQLLQEKNKEISQLETNLTNKQMSYDQLLEDYKEFQNNSHLEYEAISNQLNMEVDKYNKFKEKTTNTQYQNMLKINELEEKIRNLQIDNQQYIEKYQKVFEEKAELVETINNFTKQMSFSLSPKENKGPESNE